MKWFRSRSKRDAELREEIASHLRMAEEARKAGGASAQRAHEEARRDFGNVAIVEETARDMWGWRWLERFTQDVKFALRIFAKTPVVTAAALLSLALGIGANTAIFTLIDAVILRMLPVQHPEQLVQVQRNAPSYEHPVDSLTNPIFEELRRQQDVFTGLIAWGSTENFDLSAGGESQPVESMFVSGNYFTTLGVQPAAGRLIQAPDDQRGCAGVAVLGYGFWQQHYGGSDAAIGQLISLNGRNFPIIGITQANFFGTVVGRRFDVAIPICAEAVMHAGTTNASMLDVRDACWLKIVGRLKPGITEQQAEARLHVLAPLIYGAVVPPDWDADGQERFRNFTFSLKPAAAGISSLRQQYSRPLAVLMWIVALVLLIACANIASLMSARAAARRKEVAIRLSLGASRARLVRQLLTECILLAATGAVLGSVFAHVGTALIVRWLSTSNDAVFLDLSLHTGILVFTSAVAVATGLLFGVLPALRVTNVSPVASMRAMPAAPNDTSVFAAGGLSHSNWLRRSCCLSAPACSCAVLRNWSISIWVLTVRMYCWSICVSIS
jgi:putative ABC transport system permease protein